MRYTSAQRFFSVLTLGAAAIISPWSSLSAAEPAKPATKDKIIPIAEVKRTEPVDFQKDVLPILKKSCLACHNATQKESDLVLESPQSILKGGASGSAIDLKNPKDSLLLGRATGEVDGIMPPKGNKVAAPNLKPAELGLIKLWIEQGATGNVSGVAETLDWQPLPAGVNPIYAVALTADGQFAACGRANQVFIYHVPSGRFVCRLTDPELIKIGMYSKAGVADRDIIQSLALSPDGSLLATGGYRDVKLWRRPRNVKAGSLEAVADQTQTLAVSPDGKWAAGGGADGLVKIWDLSNGKVAKTLKGHSAAITCVRFAADGAKLFSGSLDKSIRIWNVADGAPAGQIDTPSAVNALTLVTGATPIVSGGADNKVRLWTIPAGATPQFASPAPLKALAYSPDKKSLAIGGADGKIKLVEVGTGKEIKVLTGQNGAITSLAYQADGQKLVSASSDNSVRVWDVNAGTSVATLEGCPSPAESVALHPQTKQVVAGLADGTLVLWKLENPKPEEPVKDPDTKLLAKSNGKISGLIFSSDASTLYVASAEGTLRGLQTADGKQKFSGNHGAPIHALAMSLDGKTLATGGEDKMIKIWNSANGAAGAKPQMAGLNGPVKSVTFSRDNAKVIGSAGKEALVFQLATAEVEQGFNEHGGDILALGSSGEPAEVIVSAGADNTVRSWGLLAGKQLAGHTQPVTCLDTFANAPTQIASGSADGNVRVWTTDNGQSPRQFNHGGPISGIAIRPDGQRVASAGLNKSVKLWNATNNQMVAEMKGDYRAIAHVAAVERGLNLAKATVTSEKTELAAAEKTVTAENDAVKKAKDAKTAADKTFTEKVEPAKKATDEKNVADKASTEAAAEDKKAQDAKVAAEKALADADAASKAAAEKAKLAQEAAKKEADNKTLAEAQVAADKAAQEAADKLKTAQTAKTDAEKKANETAQKAKQAADAAMAKLKPAEDAEKARKDAETAAQAATRALAASEAAAKRATDAVPKAKDELAAAEAAVKKSETDLEAAKKAATETEQPFRAVAYSPDGAEIAVAGEDKLVHTYSGETGAAFDVYTSHAGPVLAVAYVGPSKLVSDGADKTGVIWDLNPTWTLERTIGTAESSVLMDRVTALAFSPDGKLLATGSGDPSRSGELKLWNTADGSLAREVKDAHSDTVLGIEFSPNGQYVASCAADKFVKVFETATGKFVRSFEGHTHHVLGVTWRIDGKTLASCGADNVIKVWDFETGDQRRTIQGFTKEVTSIRFIGDTPNTVASSGDKTVRLANVDNGGMVRTFSGGGDFMYSAAATIDGKVIVAGGQDSVLRAWNGENGQELKTFPAPAAEGDQQASAKK